MAKLTTHSDLISALGGPPKVAEALGLESVNVRQWRLRNRIPPEHWQSLIELASDKGITARWMLDAMPPRKPIAEQSSNLALSPGVGV